MAILLACGRALAQDELPAEAGEANLRGARLRLNGDYQEAKKEFERVIRLAPGSRFGLYNRGMVWRDLGDCRSAIEDFTRALAIAPDFFGALYHRGNCRQATGEFAAAIDDYSRAIALPGRVDGRFLAYFGRADARRRSGDLEAALADYTRVAEMRTDTMALRSRAWVNLYLGRWQKSYEDAARFLQGSEGKETGSGYVALVGYIALRRLGERAKADAALAAWGTQIRSPGWPAPVLKFFGGGIGAPELAAAAATEGERLEADCYIGIAQLLAGERAKGVRTLKGVLERGDSQYWEFDLAYHELKRLGEAGDAPKRPRR